MKLGDIKIAKITRVSTSFKRVLNGVFLFRALLLAKEIKKYALDKIFLEKGAFYI